MLRPPGDSVDHAVEALHQYAETFLKGRCWMITDRDGRHPPPVHALMSVEPCSLCTTSGVTRENLMVSPGTWTLSGLLDFETAMGGDRPYEFPAAGPAADPPGQLRRTRDPVSAAPPDLRDVLAAVERSPTRPTQLCCPSLTRLAFMTLSYHTPKKIFVNIDVCLELIFLSTIECSHNPITGRISREGG